MLLLNEITDRILKGDCIEILKKIPDESIDLIVADPPYFMQTEGELLRIDGNKFLGVEDSWDKFADYQEYDSFCQAWLRECKRILKKDASIWVMGSFQNIYRIGYIMQNLGFWMLNDIIWFKTNPVPNFRGTRFCNAHETLLWCSRSSKSKVTFNYKTMKYLNGHKQERSVWKIPLCTGHERLKDTTGKKIHPTQKPEELLYKIILASSKPQDIVLDPFFGTGTTGVLAKRLARRYIGIEKEQTYIDVAEKRLQQVVVSPTEVEQLSLEIKPPKVSMRALLDKGYLAVNQVLFNQDKVPVCHIMANGHVSDNNEVLSIHQMSAKYLSRKKYNGWNYFYILRNQEFISINTLRYEYQANHLD